MAELSSNWKKLQAKLKGEGATNPPQKRKADSHTSLSSKRPRVSKSLEKAPKALNARKQKRSIAKDREGMGGVQSSKVKNEAGYAPSPSLALWAADNDVSAESLAEAYGLGIKGNPTTLVSAKDRINHGLSEGITIGKYLAIDCEMVGVGPGGHESSLARVSIVDFHGNQIYDSYVKQRERVTDWRTPVSGISIKEMRFARDFPEVQQEVASLLNNRILIGHDVKHDLDVLKLSHPIRDIRDTARHQAFKKHGHGRKPALRNLARELLHVEIQDGAHSSIEDARVTMLLFRKHKSGFDVDHANRYAPKFTTTQNSKKGKVKGK